MESNFLENVPSSITPMGAYEPDFSFLQSMQMKANAQYEQGMNEIRSKWSNIFNQKLTNGENIIAQRGYAKQAQEQMKDIAGYDLSNSKNVVAAEKILEPFYKDKDLLYDIALTQDIDNKMSEAQSNKFSRDEKIRNTYNPASVIRLQFMTEDLKRAKRGDGSIQNIDTSYSDYQPAYDIQNYVNEQDKAMGFKGIDTETDIGNFAIRKDHDGVTAIPTLKARYANMIGNKFDSYFSQLAWVQHRQELDEYARNHPDAPREVLNNNLAKDKYSKLVAMYDDNIKELGNTLHNSFELPIKNIRYEIELNQNGKMTDEQRRDLDRLENGYQKEDGTFVYGQKQYLALQSQKSNERQTFLDKHPDSRITEIANNPIGYYTQLVKQATIDELANTRASDYSSTLDVNKALVAYTNYQQENAKINLEKQRLQIEANNSAENIRYHQWQKEVEYAKVGLDKDGNPLPSQKSAETATFKGPNLTSTHNEDALNILEKDKVRYENDVVSNFFSGKDASSSVLSTLKGITPDDLLNYNTVMTRVFTGGNLYDKNFVSKPEESAAAQKIARSLFTALGKPVPTNPTYAQILEAQNEYTYQNVVHGNTLGLPNTVAARYTMNMINGQEALEKYRTTNTQQENIKNTILLTNRDMYSKFLSDDGKRIATVQDMAKYAPTLELVDDAGNKSVLSKEQFVRAYQNHGIQGADGEGITINGQHYSIQGGNKNIHSMYKSPVDKWLMSALGSRDFNTDLFFDRFGSYKERDDLNASLNVKVAEKYPDIAARTGKQGMQFQYSFEDGKDKRTGKPTMSSGVNAIIEGLSNSNYTDIQVNGESILTNQDEMNKLMALAGSPDFIKKNLGEPTITTNNTYGVREMKFMAPNFKGEGKPAEITVQLVPNPTTEFLQSIPNSEGMHMFQDYMGKEIKYADAAVKALGFDYTVTPNNKDSPAFWDINSKRLVKDMNTGVESWIPFSMEKEILTKAQGYTPEQLHDALAARLEFAMNSIMNQRLQYNKLHAK